MLRASDVDKQADHCRALTEEYSNNYTVYNYCYLFTGYEGSILFRGPEDTNIAQCRIRGRQFCLKVQQFIYSLNLSQQLFCDTLEASQWWLVHVYFK